MKHLLAISTALIMWFSFAPAYSDSQFITFPPKPSVDFYGRPTDAFGKNPTLTYAGKRLFLNFMPNQTKRDKKEYIPGKGWWEQPPEVGSADSTPTPEQKNNNRAAFVANVLFYHQFSTNPAFSVEYDIGSYSGAAEECWADPVCKAKDDKRRAEQAELERAERARYDFLYRTPNSAALRAALDNAITSNNIDRIDMFYNLYNNNNFPVICVAPYKEHDGQCFIF